MAIKMQKVALLEVFHHTAKRKPFLEYYDSCFSQNTIQNMKNNQLFLDVFVLVLLVLIYLYRPGENL